MSKDGFWKLLDGAEEKIAEKDEESFFGGTEDIDDFFRENSVSEVVTQSKSKQSEDSSGKLEKSHDTSNKQEQISFSNGNIPDYRYSQPAISSFSSLTSNHDESRCKSLETDVHDDAEDIDMLLNELKNMTETAEKGTL